MTSGPSAPDPFRPPDGPPPQHQPAQAPSPAPAPAPAPYGYANPGAAGAWPAAYPSAPPPGAYPQAYPPAPQRTDGFAIAALVFGIIGWALFSVIFGVVSLRRIRRTGRQGRGLAIAGIVLGILWIVGTIIVVSAVLAVRTTRDDSGRVTEEGKSLVNNIQVGDCLKDVPPEGPQVLVDLTPCTEPHKAEAYAAFDLPDGEYPTEARMTELSDEGCLDRIPPLDPELTDEVSYTYYYPLAQSWREGDREVICILVSTGSTLSEKIA